MKQTYTKLMAGSILAAAMATPVAATVYKAENTGKKAVKEAVVENWGSMDGGDPLLMSAAPSNVGITSRLVSFYDSNNVLLRKAEINADGTLANYYTYEYNDKGQLVRSFYRRSQELTTGAMGLSDADGITTYTYDNEGRLVSQTGNDSFKLEYDANGNISKKEVLMSDWATGELTVVQTITYSDFIAKDCPKKLTSVGAEGYADYNYVGELEYDSNNNLLKETDYTVNGDTKTYKNYTSYKYADDGMMIEKLRHQNQAIYDQTTWEVVGYEDMPVDSVVYSRDGENRIKEESYSYNSYDDSTPWSKSPAYKVTESREFDGATASVINVEKVDGKINTNKISLSSAKDGYVYDLYRDGQKVSTLGPDNTSFTDEGLQNGSHEYFAQAVKSGETNVGYNVSDVTVMENNVELPAATNLHGVCKNRITEGEEVTNTTMTVAWDAPAYTEEMGFKGYNLIEKGEYADNTVNYNGILTDSQYTIDMFNYYTEKDLYVQAVYKYGTAESEPVLIKMDDLGELSAISTVNSVAGKVGFYNNVITTEEAAKISVMDMSGKKVGEAVNATSFSLEQMPQGVYIVSVQLNGKLSVMKVRK